MLAGELDDVDRGILYFLQRDARHNTTTNIAEHVGVSSSTVGNRIHKLEDRGVIKCYRPTVDYQLAGLAHRLLVGASAPIEEQEEAVAEVMDVPGVVGVHELLSNEENLLIEMIARDRRDVKDVLEELRAAGVSVGRTEMMAETRRQPYRPFGTAFVSGNDDR